MYTVNRENPTPLYEQIKLILREQIANGELKPGVQLPTENEFCKRYAVSRITVVKALTDLAHDGLIRRIQGKGSVVNHLPIKHEMDGIRGFTASILQHGLIPSSTVLSIDLFEGDFELHRLFRLPVSFHTRFMRFKRLMFVNDAPAALFTVVVKEDVGLKMQEHHLDNASFYKLYEEILARRVTRNETTLMPVLATPEAIELLKVESGSPHFLFRGLSFVDGDIPVELSNGIFRGDFFQFDSTIYRIREEVTYKGIN